MGHQTGNNVNVTHSKLYYLRLNLKLGTSYKQTVLLSNQNCLQQYSKEAMKVYPEIKTYVVTHTYDILEMILCPKTWNLFLGALEHSSV